MEIKKVLGGLVMSVLLGGCAVGGVSHLGRVALQDGSSVEVVASKSKGSVGARITRLDVFRCRENCEHMGSEGAASDGLVDRAVSAVVPAAILGGSAVSAARMLRPARTAVQVDAGSFSGGSSGGDAVNNNIGGGSGGNAVNVPLGNTELGITINR